jgi:hypothetical protein
MATATWPCGVSWNTQTPRRRYWQPTSRPRFRKMATRLRALVRPLAKFVQFLPQTMPQRTFRTQFVQQLFRLAKQRIVVVRTAKQRTPCSRNLLFSKQVTPQRLSLTKPSIEATFQTQRSTSNARRLARNSVAVEICQTHTHSCTNPPSPVHVVAIGPPRPHRRRVRDSWDRSSRSPPPSHRPYSEFAARCDWR